MAMTHWWSAELVSQCSCEFETASSCILIKSSCACCIDIYDINTDKNLAFGRQVTEVKWTTWIQATYFIGDFLTGWTRFEFLYFQSVFRQFEAAPGDLGKTLSRKGLRWLVSAATLIGGVNIPAKVRQPVFARGSKTCFIFSSSGAYDCICFHVNVQLAVWNTYRFALGAEVGSEGWTVSSMSVSLSVLDGRSSCNRISLTSRALSCTMPPSAIFWFYQLHISCRCDWPWRMTNKAIQTFAA